MFMSPQALVSQFGFAEGMRVADFGSGSGHFALAVAPLVGYSGRVYAIDIQKDLLGRIKDAASARHLRNLEVVRADIDSAPGVPLQNASLDAVILSNILFQLEDRAMCVKEVKRLLKRDGEAIVIDWSSSFGNMGPTPESVLTKEAVETLFKEAGFSVVRDFEAGDHHYGLVFKNP